MCKTLKSGVSNCNFDPAPTAAELSTDLPNLVSNMNEDTAEISVAEDRGAILVNVVGHATSLCTDFKAATKFNLPFNGGRPF